MHVTARSAWYVTSPHAPHTADTVTYHVPSSSSLSTQAAHEEELKKQISTWNPQEDKHMEGSDPYTTLFVARLDYTTTEEDLKEAFKSYGKIRSVRVVSGPDGKSRGYGFIEFDHKHELDAAYKYGDGKIVGARRVLADIEKGRIVKNWRPRRLGGGLGKTRVGKPSQNDPPARKVLPGDRREAERRGGERAAPGRGERDGDRDLHHSRRDRRDRDTDRDRDRGGYRGGDRDRDRDRGGRDRERDSHRDRDRDRDRDHDRDRDRYGLGVVSARAHRTRQNFRRDDRDRRRPRW